MAYQLEAWIQFESIEQCARVVVHLGRDTRTDFPEDLSLSDRRIHEVVGDLDFPEEIDVQAPLIRAFWFEAVTDLPQVERAMQRAGGEVLAAFVVPDDADAADDPADGHDPVDGFYFLRLDGQLRRVTTTTVRKRFKGKKVPALSFPDFSRKLRILVELIRSAS